MRGATVRCANVDDAAMNTPIGSDMFQPGFLAFGQLSEPTTEHKVFEQTVELGVERDDGLEHFVVDLGLFGFLSSLFRHPAARFGQFRNLFARVPIFDLRKLLAKARFKRDVALRPLFAPLFSGFGIKRNAGGCDLVADRYDAMFERERLGGLSVRLQQLPDRFGQARVTDATLL